MNQVTTPAPSIFGRATNGLTELWNTRQLVWALVARDLRVKHRGTVFGMLWSLATPALMVALYTFIFSVMFRLRPAPNSQAPFAVYFFAGLVIWNFFASAVQGAVSSIVGSGYLLRKVYFARAALPLSNVLSSFVTFLFEFAVLIVIIVITGVVPDLLILTVPAIVAAVFVFSYGLGLILATLTVFFRDVAHFIGIVMQVWFWGTPIIYSLDLVAGRPKLQTVLLLNPMTPVVTAFRRAVLGEGTVQVEWLAYSAAVFVLTLGFGAVLFARKQRLFAELV